MEVLDEAFAGRVAAECPWGEFVKDPELLAFTDPGALVVMLPWLVLSASEPGDLAAYLASMLRRHECDEPRFADEVAAAYGPRFLQSVLGYLDELAG